MLVIIAVVALIVLLLLFFILGYKKAPPDIAFIVSGIKKKPRIVIGKSVFVIPFLERVDALDLGLFKIDVRTQDSIPTQEYINIKVDSVVTVKIRTDEEGVIKASENFLNVSKQKIAEVINDVLEGSLREIIGTMQLKDIVSNRKELSLRVEENASKDLEKMGLEIISFNVQNFYDENDVIKNLGIDNTEKIKKDAAIAKAEAVKETRIAQAEAERQAKEAEVESNKQISIRQNELAIKQAELKKESDGKKAEADAAYDIQTQIQRKEKEVSSVNADIAKREKEIELKTKEVDIREKELDSLVKKEADADLYKTKQTSDANLYRVKQSSEADMIKQQRESEAYLYSQQKEAEAIKAKAEAIKIEAEAQSQKVKLIGLAEAEAESEKVRRKGLAEAEAMEKKAEAYQKYNNVALAEQFIKILPEIAAEIAKPLAQIDKITIIGSDSSGVGSVSDHVPQVMAKMIESVKETTGIDLINVINANSYDAKVNKNINISGDLTPVKEIFND